MYLSVNCSKRYSPKERELGNPVPLAVAQLTYRGWSGGCLLLDELQLLIKEVVFLEVMKMRVYADRTQRMMIQEDLVQVLLQGQGSFHDLLGFIPLILRWLLHILEECMAQMIIL